jgi:2-dehydropantoate 2-reductase
MTIHILGAGSIGLLYASYMRMVPHKMLPICLLLQRHHEAKVNAYRDFNLHSQPGMSNQEMMKLSSLERRNINTFVWVHLRDKQGKVHIQDIPCEIIGDSNSHQDISNLLLTTKAPQAVQALESIFPRFKDHVNLFVMTNGSLAVVDEIRSSLTRNGMENNVKIIYACSTHGAIRSRHTLGFGEDLKNDEHSFSVTHTGSGQTFIEVSDGVARSLYDTWNDSPLNPLLVSSEAMCVINWKKLAANCAINPLTALRNCRNGELLAGSIRRLSYEDTTAVISDLDYHKPEIFYRLIREVSDVALADSRNMRMGEQEKKQLEYDELADFVESVIHQTSQNKSSMLQDVIGRQYPTEVNYLNGFISRLGHHIPGINVKANAYIVEEIEKLTSSFRIKT